VSSFLCHVLLTPVFCLATGPSKYTLKPLKQNKSFLLLSWLISGICYSTRKLTNTHAK
jgi:hypothetical protein